MSCGTRLGSCTRGTGDGRLILGAVGGFHAIRRWKVTALVRGHYVTRAGDGLYKMNP
jgi:hypothetical protein